MKKERKKKEKIHSSPTSRPEKERKKGRLTRLGCWGWDIKSFLQVCQVFFHSSSLELVNFCFLQTLVDRAILPIGSLLQCHGRIQCLQPVLELFHWSRQNAGREIIKRKKNFQKKNKLTPWLELWVIESPVVTTMMKMKMKVVLPFAVPSAKKEKEKRKGRNKKEKGKRSRNSKKKKKKSESHKNRTKMTERMRRRRNVP